MDAERCSADTRHPGRRPPRREEKKERERERRNAACAKQHTAIMQCTRRIQTTPRQDGRLCQDLTGSQRLPPLRLLLIQAQEAQRRQHRKQTMAMEMLAWETSQCSSLAQPTSHPSPKRKGRAHLPGSDPCCTSSSSTPAGSAGKQQCLASTTSCACRWTRPATASACRQCGGTSSINRATSSAQDEPHAVVSSTGGRNGTADGPDNGSSTSHQGLVIPPLRDEKKPQTLPLQCFGATRERRKYHERSMLTCSHFLALLSFSEDRINLGFGELAGSSAARLLPGDGSTLETTP